MFSRTVIWGNTRMFWKVRAIPARVTRCAGSPSSSRPSRRIDPALAKPDGDGKILWYDLRHVDLEGQGWKDTKAAYDRLPARAEGVVREAVWNLSRRSAGLCVRFVSDAPAIHARWTLTGKDLAMPHMPATAVSGLDLVKMQLRVAAGERLPFKKGDCAPRGHAIECRINAEDPAARFRPGPGTLLRYRAPTGPGIRVDSGVYQGYAIPSQYDSLIAKLVAWGRDRQEARLRMLRALRQFDISGVPSTIPFH